MKLNWDSQSVYYIVAASATIIGLIYKIGGTVIKALKKEIGTLKEDRKKLHVVFSEVTSNHGTSIKDKVNSLEKNVDHNTRLTEKIFFRQRWIMENQDIPIFETDSNGLFDWCNEEFAHLFGKSASHFMGNAWKNIVHPDDRNRVEKHWESCVKDKIDIEDVFRAMGEDRVLIVKLVANKTEGGWIGSITKRGCDSTNCPDCKTPELCERYRSKKRTILVKEEKNGIQKGVLEPEV